MVRNGPRPLVAKALRDRARNGPDGGVRAGIARLLPWAFATRAQMERRWNVDPGAGVGAMGRRRSGRTRVPVSHHRGSNSRPRPFAFNLPLESGVQAGELEAGEPVAYRARLVPLTAAWPLEAGRLANLMMSRSIRSSTCDHW